MKTELNISFVIKRLMNVLNYSSATLADFLGVEPRQINNYINRHNNPSPIVFNKIISLINDNNLDIYDLFDIEGNDGYLFHGSKVGGIIGDISTTRNINEPIDFGNGFYLSETFKTAISYVITYPHPVIYRFNEKDILKTKIYSFYDDKVLGEEDWVLFIGYNRYKIKEERDRVFIREYFDKKFAQYDVLKGEIADSYNFDIMDAFFDEVSDINEVKKALKFANIGPQYVLKNETVAKSLKWVDEYHIETRLKNYLIGLISSRKKYLKKAYEETDKSKRDESLKFEAIKNRKIMNYGR
ncbi:MAG: DUF3990 domain-containing protein [Erysipelotrichaceae bacterium]|nr:DUF3990 domain-containing protein [Erysipelotrichaceae bacterium]